MLQVVQHALDVAQCVLTIDLPQQKPNWRKERKKKLK